MATQLLSNAKNNVASPEHMRQFGVSYPAAWLVKRKFMEAVRMREAIRQLHGRVELNDAYVGGERSVGKTGRGSETKVPFVQAAQTTGDGLPHQVCTAALLFRRQALTEFCARHLLPLTVVSDGLDAIRMAARAGVQQRVVIGRSKASATHPEFCAVNIVLGNLKTTIADLPRLRLQQVRPAPPRLVPVPLQPPLPLAQDAAPTRTPFGGRRLLAK